MTTKEAIILVDFLHRKEVYSEIERAIEVDWMFEDIFEAIEKCEPYEFFLGSFDWNTVDIEDKDIMALSTEFENLLEIF